MSEEVLDMLKKHKGHYDQRHNQAFHHRKSKCDGFIIELFAPGDISELVGECCSQCGKLK